MLGEAGGVITSCVFVVIVVYRCTGLLYFVGHILRYVEHVSCGVGRLGGGKNCYPVTSVNTLHVTLHTSFVLR